jgi:hypothetical protein
MWHEPYLETCCRSALHRLVLSGTAGRPAGLKDGPCLERLAGMGLARMRGDGHGDRQGDGQGDGQGDRQGDGQGDRRYEITAEGAGRHATEVARRPPGLLRSAAP